MSVVENTNFDGLQKRLISLKRAADLRKIVKNYQEKKDLIKTGFDLQDIVQVNKQRLLQHFGATEDNWNDWHWQLAHRIGDVETLAKIFDFSEHKCFQIKTVGQHYRWSVSPYFASLIVSNEDDDPVLLEAIPSIKEMDHAGYDDPMAEEFTNPAPCITRRYPDRVIINVTNLCATYCRHCQRRRNIGDVDKHQSDQNLLQALEYIRQNPEIRDVLITGGDALLLSDQKLDWLLSELDAINHVEIKRIGTRTIVTLPQRITPELIAVLKKHPPIFINTQFNHPHSITPEVKSACDMLSEAGVVLGNQAVLLKGVNNDPDIMKKLGQELLKIRVRPYYIFHAKAVRGTSHFITTVDEGLEIMEKLRGYTSGLAVPTYIINLPGGYGKVPITPNYVLNASGYLVHVRNWEGKKFEFSLLPGGE